ncbi:MAG TPA: sulfotransferase [Anaerolineales bacterium]|nr:sulfotransferase [Anaerolineales bacterium]
MSSENPIFVAGPDRSGTSLIFALLASHPNICMVRRTNMWRYFHERYGDLSQRENFERCLSDMTRYKRMRHLKPDVECIRCEFLKGEATYGRLFSLFHRHHAERNGKPRWGDKSLHTEHYADRILREYPDAKIVHMSRDPRDRYASVRKRHGRDTPRLGASTGRWLFSMSRAFRNRNRFPNNYKIVRFEDIIFDPEGTLRDVCAFVGEEFAPEMVTMCGAADHTNVGGNSSFEKIEPGKISQKPVGRFQKVLSSLEILFIQMFTGQFMKQLGYQAVPVKLSAREMLKFYVRLLPSSLVRMVGWIGLNMRMIRRGEPVPQSRLVSASTIDNE